MTFASSKKDSSQLYCCVKSENLKNLKTSIAVLYYAGYIMAKTQGYNVTNGLDTRQNKAVHLAG